MSFFEEIRNITLEAQRENEDKLKRQEAKQKKMAMIEATTKIRNAALRGDCHTVLFYDKDVEVYLEEQGFDVVVSTRPGDGVMTINWEEDRV